MRSLSLITACLLLLLTLLLGCGRTSQRRIVDISLYEQGKHAGFVVPVGGLDYVRTPKTSVASHGTVVYLDGEFASKLYDSTDIVLEAKATDLQKRAVLVKIKIPKNSEYLELEVFRAEVIEREIYSPASIFPRDFSRTQDLKFVRSLHSEPRGFNNRKEGKFGIGLGKTFLYIPFEFTDLVGK